MNRWKMVRNLNEIEVQTKCLSILVGTDRIYLYPVFALCSEIDLGSHLLPRWLLKDHRYSKWNHRIQQRRRSA
jgi:hypothetical protein